eukprot:TRINITY_DN8290_c0_g1_i1.p1 TRINITY_DN8290_c0_g1~~TRINITY_DN8290_c0_g1_i1.p1  ORF type:complete len:655 (-),score=119.22 TRINITY_DN8290_c0_g1_i1:44-2008(-)
MDSVCSCFPTFRKGKGYKKAPGFFELSSFDGDKSELQLKKTSLDSAWKIVKSLLPYFWPKNDVGVRVRVVVCIIILLIARGINIYVPILYKNAIDQLPAVFPLGNLLAWGTLSLVQRSLGDMRDTIFQHVSQEATLSLSSTTFAHVHSLSLNFHLSKRTGTLVKTIDRGTNAISSLLSLLLFNIVPTILELIVVSVVLWTGYGFWLSVIAFFSTVAYISFTLIITEWRNKYRKASNLKENEASDISMDSLTNFEMIKYFTAEKHELTRYTKAYKEYMDISMKSRLSLTILNFGQNFINVFAVVFAVILAAKAVTTGRFTIGDIVAVNAYIVQLYVPLSWLGSSYRMIIQSFTDMEKLFDLLETKPEVKDKENPQDLILSQFSSPDIEFRNVSFRYNNNSEIPLLKNISFHVPSGKSFALVGQSGQGKTSIFRLLCRFYDVNEGEILINGQNIKDITQESLRAAIGVVPQDTVLFNDTIEYNVWYGNRKATKDDIIDAVKAASLYDFISTTPLGFETKVGERGLRLSGGEKSRVAIARVLLKNPPVLVLDEATSALDSKTEKEIQNSLNEVSKGRTSLVIAHRLSTIVGCDEILVLKNGSIVERGTHSQLLELNGEYASMWNQQLKNLPSNSNTDKIVEVDQQKIIPASSSASLI